MSHIFTFEEEKDIELYEKFLKGEKEAFNTIVTRHRKNLISFIMKYVRNLDVAEDLAQDTFLYVLINRKEYDFKYTLKTYLYTIAKCRAINHLKKAKRNIPLEENYIFETDIIEIDNELIKEENKKKILEAIKKLKQEYQVVIYLKDFQNFKYNEISKILNKTMPQVKMLMHRARKKLKQVLEKEGAIC